MSRDGLGLERGKTPPNFDGILTSQRFDIGHQATNSPLSRRLLIFVLLSFKGLMEHCAQAAVIRHYHHPRNEDAPRRSRPSRWRTYTEPEGKSNKERLLPRRSPETKGKLPPQTKRKAKNQLAATHKLLVRIVMKSGRLIHDQSEAVECIVVRDKYALGMKH